MNKMRMLFFAVVGVLASATATFAQVTETVGVAGDNANTVAKWRAVAAAFGFAIAVAGGAIGQSRIAASAVEGAARNPGAAARIQTIMILGLVFIESLVIFTLVIMFAIVRGEA